MTSAWLVTLDVTVLDEKDLYRDAREHMINVDGVPPEEVDLYLLDDAGEVEVSSCLTALFDPGSGPNSVSINQSSASQYYAEGP